MDAPTAELADCVEKLLMEPQQLLVVGGAAAAKARAWDLQAYAVELVMLVERALALHKKT